MAIDRRYILAATFKTEKRSASGDDALIVEARINKYGVLSNENVPVAGARERFVAGAFSDSLAAGDDVLGTLNHDQNVPLGRVSNGRLQLRDTNDGLYATFKLNPKVQMHNDIYQLCKDGTVNTCSFAFAPSSNGEKWTSEKDERGQSYMLRTISSAKLFDVSLLSAQPAYPQTAVNARALAYRFADNTKNADIDAELRRRAALYAEDIRLQGVTDPSCRAVIMRALPGTDPLNPKNLRAYRDYDRERQLKALDESRSGFGFEVASDGGGAADPTQSLRCKAASTSSSPAEHRKAAMAHRVWRDHAKTADDYSLEDSAAQDHDDASDYDNGDDDTRARAAIRCAARCGRVSK